MRITSDLHDRIVAQRLDELRADPDVLAVLLTGSVARGDQRPDSDIDLFALLREGTPKRVWETWREGILVECTARTESRVRETLASDPKESYRFTEGRILHDPSGTLADLAQLAARTLAHYHLSLADRRVIVKWLRAAQLKLTGAINMRDDFRAGYAVATTSWMLITGLFAVNQRPVPMQGAVRFHLPTLLLRPDDLDDLLAAVFTDPSANERARAAEELAAWILERLDIPLDGPLGVAYGSVRLADAHAHWAETYASMAARIRTVLGARCDDVEHVGSTAVPGLVAKPIIDIAVRLAPGASTREVIDVLSAAGYEYRGDKPHHGGILFVLNGLPWQRIAHIHVVEHDDQLWDRYLRFRDHLRVDPQARDTYAALKRELAARHEGDRGAYTRGKATFVEELSE